MKKISLLLLSITLLGINCATNPKYGNLDNFTKCLKDKGVVFYGAFWCPHCQNQKKEFASSQKYLPYVECSTPDGRSMVSTCREKNIESFPTWDFADGSRQTGEMSLEKLAEKSGCELPPVQPQN